jgi:Ca2+-binding EF-hand superfamily protein
MTKLQSSLFAAVTLLTSLAVPAFAEGDHARPTDAQIAEHIDKVFARLDTDKDGRISQAEAAKGKRLAKHFDKIDADHDGFVSRAELNAAMQHKAHAKS